VTVGQSVVLNADKGIQFTRHVTAQFASKLNLGQSSGDLVSSQTSQLNEMLD